MRIGALQSIALLVPTLAFSLPTSADAQALMHAGRAGRQPIVRRGDRHPVGPSAPVHALTSARPAARDAGLPTWTGSFVRDGVTYPYTIVGSDPRRGASSTKVSVLIVPLRFEFPSQADADLGGVHTFDPSTDLIDGQTAIDGILRSPLFSGYPFNVGGVDLGVTQFADAYARANIWGQLGSGRNYHVTLEPTIAPTQTIVVPYDEWWEIYDSSADAWRPAVTDRFLVDHMYALFDTIGATPSVLPVFITGQVSEVSGSLGGHGPRGAAPGDQTWIFASYMPAAWYGGYAPDVSVLGHEILEWLNDPFGSNDVPGWPMGPIPYTSWCLDRILEVADPLEDDPSTTAIPIPPLGTDTFTYHLPDAVFLDYFTHTGRSGAAGGRYSFFGAAQGPSPACVGDDAYQTERIDVPGAAFTYPTGINDAGHIVGYFGDASGTHAFQKSGTRTTVFNVPGAAWTVPSAINTQGQIAGYYSDGARVHAFLRTGSQYQTLDVPGATATVGLNLNQWGDVAGEYVTATGIQGFVFANGHFASVAAPGAPNALVSGINRQGDLAVEGLDAAGALLGSYLRTGGAWVPLVVPGGTHDTAVAAVDNSDRVAGTFATDWYGFTDGFYRQADGTYVRLLRTDFVNGMNNRGQIVGFRDGHAFVATLRTSP